MRTIQKKDRRIAVLLLGFLILGVAGAGLLLLPNSHEWMTPGNTAMTVEGEKVSVGCLNYLYKSLTHPVALKSFAKEHGYELNDMPLDEQIFDPKTGQSIAQYMQNAAMEQMEQMVSLSIKAKECGLSLTDEQAADVEAFLESLEGEAKDAGLSLNRYASIHYGSHVGKQTLRKMLTCSYLAQNYLEYFYVVDPGDSLSPITSSAPDRKELAVSLREFMVPFSDAQTEAETEQSAEALLNRIKTAQAPEYMFAITADYYETDSEASPGGWVLISSETQVPDDLVSWLNAKERLPGDLLTIRGNKGIYFFFYRGLFDKKEESKIQESLRQACADTINRETVNEKYGMKFCFK